MAVPIFNANPFPGIRSYEITESHLFYGRELQVGELKNRLFETRFLAIVGSSGCGKSSLVQAGLIPSLMTGETTGINKLWKLVLFRPGDNPVRNLAVAIDDPRYDPDDIVEKLMAGENGLVDILSGILAPGGSILICIDQFEELFRFKRNRPMSGASDEARAFTDLILAAIRQTRIPVYTIVSMRTDFLDECTEFRELGEMINKGYYLVPRMNRDEMRLAITGPVATANGAITGDLVSRLLEDIGDNADQLPVLQHAMMRMWENWSINKTGDIPISEEHYLAIGTMKEALSFHLEEIYAELPDARGRFLAEKIFKALTDTSGKSRGTRRPTRISELCTLTNAGEEEIIRLIENFRGPGRAFLMPPAHITLHSDSTIDISHESIMRIWDRLRKWTEEESESAQLYLRLSKSAELYQDGKTGLWTDPELQLALHWKEQNRPNATWAARYDPAFDRAITFLDYSHKQHVSELTKKENQQKRNLKRARNSAIVLGIASLVSIFFLIISLNLRFKAEASRKEALEKEKLAVFERKQTEEQRKEAILQKKISEQQQQIAEQQEMISEQQRQYAVKQQMIAQQQTVIAIEQKKQADVASRNAMIARDEADSQRREALSQKQIADTERVKAEESEKAARRLRLLATSKSMAIQALQLHTTVRDDLPALLAVTAFQMNADIGGVQTDPTIFKALSAISSDQVVLRGHQDAVRAVVLTENGKELYSCGDDSRVLYWNRDETSKPPVPVEIPPNMQESFRSIILTRDGKWLAAGTSGGKIIVWKKPFLQNKPMVFTDHHATVNKLAADPNRNRFFSCGSDGRLLQWQYEGDTFTNFLVDSVPGAIRSLAIRPDGQKLIYTTGDGLVKSFMINQTSARPVTLLNLRVPVLSATFSGDGEILALGCQDASIRIYHPAVVPLIGETLLGRHLSAITGLAFSPGNNELASCSFDWTVKFSEFPAKEENTVAIEGHEKWVYDVLFTPDCKNLISCSADKTIRISSTRNGEMAEKLKQKLSRNLTPEEWKKMVGEDIPYHKTREHLP